jgi:hypothetical protein
VAVLSPVVVPAPNRRLQILGAKPNLPPSVASFALLRLIVDSDTDGRSELFDRLDEALRPIAGDPLYRWAGQVAISLIVA